jgi:hypothetical protein
MPEPIKQSILKGIEIVIVIAGLIFTGGIAYATFETKEGAKEKYVSKEVYEQVTKQRDTDRDNITSALRRIEDKLDNHMTKK